MTDQEAQNLVQEKLDYAIERGLEVLSEDVLLYSIISDITNLVVPAKEHWANVYDRSDYWWTTWSLLYNKVLVGMIDQSYYPSVVRPETD